MSDKIIKIDDVEGKVYELDNWKPTQATQVKNHFTEKFKELKNEYKKIYIFLRSSFQKEYSNVSKVQNQQFW